MKYKRGTTGILILALLLCSVLMLSGCDSITGIFGDKRSACSGNAQSCNYYTGSRGIISYLQTPPNTIYYNTKDATSIDGNVVEFNVMNRNDGASDAYGATFISGFAPELFQLYIVDKNGERPIIINKADPGCYFDFSRLGFNSGALFGLTAGCNGVGVYGGGNSWGLDLDFKKLGLLFGKQWPDISVDLRSLGDGNYDIGLGYDGVLINALNHGALLMAFASNLNFERYGGSVFAYKGDNEDSPGGDLDYKTFKARMIGEWPAGQDYFQIPYQIKNCYAYTTFVSPMICIDPNPFSDEKKVCTAESYSWGGSQGAPVAVTSLQQTNTGQEVILDITIKNVGPGKVWDVGYLEACSPYYPGRVTSNMYNVVYIGQAWIGSKPVDCSRNYKIRLDPNTQSATFTCRYDIRNAGDVGSAYTIPLKMELWYGYEETISNQLRVRRLS